MIPKDLSDFSIEQLRGFAIAVAGSIASLKDEAAGDPDKLAALEGLLDNRDALQVAIQARLDADGAEDAVDAATEAAGDDDGDEDSDDAADEDAESEDDKDDADDEGAEGAVDDAVASAQMGGGDAPRVTRDEGDKMTTDMRKFVRQMVNGNVRHEERHSFATLRRETDQVVREGQNVNAAIQAAIAGRADGSDRTAAGCFCGPDDAITAIKQCGETNRPLSDTLPTLTASGDVRYVRQIDLNDALTGVTEWTCADQALVDPEVVATWKPCYELECEDEQTSSMYAVTACASFSTQQMIGNPALVDNLQHVMEVAYNKTAELLVYNRLLALSSQYTYGLATTGYGASAQLLSVVGYGLEMIRAALRESDPGYTLVLPAGLIERVVTDGTIRGFGDYRSRDDILDRLDAIGVTSVVELVDEITGVPAPLAHPVPVAPGGPAIAAPAQPLEQQILLYRPEDFVLGVGPDIDLGAQRSPELARQNKLQWFTESFEFVEKVGCAPALSFIAPFCQSGVRPALGEGESCPVV